MSAPSSISVPRGRSRPGRAGSPAAALFRRALLDARVRTIVFAYVFAAVAYVNPLAYRHSYATLSSRLAFAHSFAHNKAVVLFYGKAYDLLTVGGYAAWRSAGILTILAAVFGLLAAVRALRAEEDTGRAELVLASAVGRRLVFWCRMAAIAAGITALWLGAFLGAVLAKLPVGGSAYMGLAIASVAPVFVGVGALAGQLAPNRRVAIQLGAGIVGLSFLLRVVADTTDGALWLHWLTPLGWAEELRPFTGAHPLVLLLPLASTAIMLAVAARLEAGRDIGAGLLPARDTTAPRLRLLSSTTAHALREQRGSLLAWFSGVAVFALIVGVVSKSINSAGISKSLQDEFAKFGVSSIVTPRGYIAFAFIFFVLAVSLFMCAQVAVARYEENEQHLETLFALPVSRRAWLAGRLALALAGAVGISLCAGGLTWVGAEAAGVSLSLPRMLAAGVNCLPTAVLSLGMAALAYAALPRPSAGIAYGLVALAFLWYLFGALLGAPRWLIDATPFAHVAAVPVQPFRVLAAIAMVGIGLAAAAGAIEVFRRRDLLGA